MTEETGLNHCAQTENKKIQPAEFKCTYDAVFTSKNNAF